MNYKKIAFDFDGVIADTSKEKMKWIKKNGLKLEKADKTSFFEELRQSLPQSEIERLYKEMSKSIFLSEVLEKTQPVEGSIEKIKLLSLKFDIYIITARTEKLIEPVREWLKKYNIDGNIKEIISSSYEAKQDICLKNSICFLCDDDIGHVIDKKVEKRVLFNKREKETNDGIIVTDSWDEIEKILLELIN